MKAEEQQSKSSTQAEARWLLVERVAAAGSLQRSARLRLLLLHVGRHTIFDGAPLHEMEIGFHVFGRPMQYDTSQDNIVRVNFSELRKRLRQYFAGEGKEEAEHFDIPRGSYELRFFDRPPDAFDQVFSETQSKAQAMTALIDQAEDTHSKSAPNVQQSRVRTLLLTCYMLTFFAVAALVTAGLAWWQRKEPAQISKVWLKGPVLKRFWEPFFDGPEPVDIVLADSSLALAQDLTGKDLPLSDYISYNYQPLYEAEAEQQRQQTGVTKLLLARNMGSIGDFKAASIMRALGYPEQTRIVAARGYSVASARDHNSILLGSRRSNPWVELIENQLQYRFGTSPDRRQTTIDVLQPHAGEQRQYVSVSEPSSLIGYAVIAVLPSPGANAHMLLIAGTNSQATLAAAELLTNERKLEVLSRLLGGKPMDHVQLLLRAETMRDTPIDAQILSVRTDF